MSSTCTRFSSAATRQALEAYGYRERLTRLAERNENFLFTGLWKKHAHVYEFLRSGQCFAALTDSGSMQEELNHIDETICLTARFSTDRPETVFDANTNLLVPPISGQFVRETVEFLADRRHEDTFEWAHERLGFGQQSDDTFEYL